MEEIAKLKSQIEMMERYLLLKVEVRDWHGVADAAMDLRELEATLRALQPTSRSSTRRR